MLGQFFQSHQEKPTARDILDGCFEREWKETRGWLTENEWLEIFPEGRSCLVEKLEGLRKKREVLNERYKAELRRTYQAKLKGFSLWFAEKIIEIWFIFPLNKLDKSITKLKWVLYPPKQKAGQITDEMIERARHYPIERLLSRPVKNGVTTCPFHKAGREKKPSLNVKNNYYFCHTCLETGDTIALVMKTRGLDFKQAVQVLV